MASGRWLTTKQVGEEYHLSKGRLKELREKQIIKAVPEGNKFLYFRESIENYFNARATGPVQKSSSQKMVLSPYEEKIHIKGGNKMRWKNGNGSTPRINLGDFSLLESKKNGGEIVYYIDYYDDKGRYTKSLSKLAKQFGFDRGIIADRKAAEVMGRKVRNALYEQEKSQTVNKRDITFGEFAEIYLKAINGKKANSLKTVRAAIEGSLVPYFGHVKLSELNLEKTLDYVQKLKDKPIMDSTISNYLIAFGSMIDFADRYEYAIKRKDKIIHVKDYHLKSTKRMRKLEADEEPALFKVADSFWKRLLRVALDTGLRLGNINGLTWSWVDFDSRMIIVPADAAKGGEDIEIHLTNLATEILEHMRGENPEDKFVFMRQINGSGRQPLSERWIQNEFKNLIEKAGIDDLHFHDLRRTFAMRLVGKGVDVLTLKGCMGHKNINSTMCYVKEDPALVKKAFRLLDQENEGQ